MLDYAEIHEYLIKFKKARRMSTIQVTKDTNRRRKSSAAYRGLMTLVDSETDEQNDNLPEVCKDCRMRTGDHRGHQDSISGDYIPLQQSLSDHERSMAFSAIVVGRGSGGKYTNKSRPSLQEDHESHQMCRCCSKSGSIHRKNAETVKLNVGGTIFETRKTTLSRLKTCKLANEYEMKKYYRESQGDYFFDRDPQTFTVIINYLRTGELHLPTYMCGPALQREFDYWGVDEMDIERCCWQPYNTWKTQNRSLEKLEYDRKRSTTHKDMEEDRKSSSCWRRTRAVVWNFLQDPSSSCGAKIYAWISILFVFMSIFSFCAETHPLFRVHESETRGFETIYRLFALTDPVPIPHNMSHGDDSRPEFNSHEVTSGEKPDHVTRNSSDNHTHGWKHGTVPHPALVIIDLICVSFFTVELVTRFVFCPRKMQFVTALQNIIDFVAILPDYVEFIIHAVHPVKQDMPFMDFIVILRLLRLCRSFRLIRHVPGLWILLYTLKASFNELLLMFVFLLIGMVVFASLIHFAEPDKGFDTIPIGFWWSVITMTTVGYGDLNPTTALGYVIGSLCAISGLLFIAFTVPIIVSNFVLYYTHVQYGSVRQEKDKPHFMGSGHDTDDEAEDLHDVHCIHNAGKNSVNGLNHVRESHILADSSFTESNHKPKLERDLSSGYSSTKSTEETYSRY